MKTIAYTCSYELNEKTATEEVSKQVADIKNFCKVHEIELSDTYTETSTRDDFKPVLLNIMSNCFGNTDRLIIANYDVISRNKDFLDWIKDEFNRMKIEIVSLEKASKPQELFSDKNCHI